MFEIFDADEPKVTVIDGGHILVESIPSQQKTKLETLRFDPINGTMSVDTPYLDFTSSSSEKILQHFVYYGIVGCIDFGFAKHIFLATKRELVTTSDKAVLSIWKLKDVISIPIFRRQLSLTLDEEEFESVTLRDLKKQFTLGDLYFSSDMDLTNGLQYMAQQIVGESQIFPKKVNFEDMDDRFFWNKYMLKPLMDTKYHSFIVPLIFGYVGSINLTLDGPPATLVIMSRVSRYRAGKRYWVRGVDQSGNVAIEVETDMLAITPGKTASFRILRGSVPLIWNQQSVGLFRTPSINLDKIFSDESLAGMELHFERLLNTYGGQVHVVDMLNRNSKGSDTAALSLGYEEALRSWNHPDIKYHKLESIENSQTAADFASSVAEIITQQGFFLCTNKTRNQQIKVLRIQQGIIRINNLDCTDEASISQSIVAREALKMMLIELGCWYPNRTALDQTYAIKLRQIWADMADSLSFYYVGTRMLHQYYIKKTWFLRFFGPFIDSLTHISRLYMSHFQLYLEHDSIDFFMGIPPQNQVSIPSQIMLRRRLIFVDISQRWLLALILILKRFTAPRQIRNWIQFILAIYWMIIYWILVNVFRVDKSFFVRKPKSLVNIDSLPDLSGGPRHGIAIYMEKLEKKDREKTDNSKKRPVQIYVETNGPRFSTSMIKSAGPLVENNRQGR
ncbi:SacI homology domain-containing protein [Globomyces pollinis-pini]|nr:SacI homology domain-containing protein [Globomyces pollinis-pini]